uniref:Potassium voltage-gated channel subfamily E regulatory subunit 3 n=2 Tax=Felinae TaxID=338152 RepID=A0A667GUU7_LYNCA
GQAAGRRRPKSARVEVGVLGPGGAGGGGALGKVKGSRARVGAQSRGGALCANWPPERQGVLCGGTGEHRVRCPTDGRAPLRGLPRGRASSSSLPTSIPIAMETTNGTETWYKSLHAVLKALNATIHNNLLCRPGPDNLTEKRRASLPGRDDNSYMYILFVMFLFAVTVGSLILGYTRSRKVDKRSDPYHVYIKNRVSMI